MYTEEIMQETVDEEGSACYKKTESSFEKAEAEEYKKAVSKGGREGSKNSGGRGKAGSEAVVKSKCGLNEEYKICGELCEGSCSSAELVCMKESGPPCVCKKGFFRNTKGKCVKDCSTEPCPVNMVRKSCAMPASCQEACESSLSSKVIKPPLKKPGTKKALPATKKPNQVSRKPKPKSTKKLYRRTSCKEAEIAYVEAESEQKEKVKTAWPSEEQ
ncbi:trypsin Inhibitor like cysteine rich domain protein [Oesophagostomum dentatum]|uniref:Trypsin Inhibitor like cysteine rich domain protein n=1 Tax=Oesophagostomum dentatum TaxID=61180 RepID=A0A0B1T547_OESDE|nr:trypsin Inhibitor like cysteine rich domain protein [Oesophagostomum dentatum]